MAIPVTAASVAAHLRLTPGQNDMDTDIADWIADAAAWVERYTGHILEQREVTEVLDGFARPYLNAWPIAADAMISASYSGPNGLITLEGVRLDVTDRPARLLAPIGGRWPPLGRDASVTVSFTAGYGPTEYPPRNFHRAMLILISAYDSDREGGDMFAKAEAAARRLLSSYRRRKL